MISALPVVAVRERAEASTARMFPDVNALGLSILDISRLHAGDLCLFSWVVQSLGCSNPGLKY